MLAVLLKFLSLRRFPTQHAVGIVGFLLAAAAFGCGRPFNVKTQPALPSINYAAKANVENIVIEALAITDEDYLYDTFDANLIGAGVLPVRVKLTNSGSEPVEFKNARLEIETPSKRFKSVDSRKSFKRLISYYGISVYSKAGYKESLDAFASYSLELETPLAASESRQGLVFFPVPAEAARQPGLNLVISRLKSKRSDDRTSLKLN